MRAFALPYWFWSNLVLVLQVLLVVSPARAGESAIWEARAKKPVPDGVKVTLEVDRREYFLGEDVLVHFILENTSGHPFEADFGGDYRGAT